MKSSQVLKDLQHLRKEWRIQNFHFTAEQKKKYEELVLQRREIVRGFYANDRVWVGSSNAGSKTREAN